MFLYKIMYLAMKLSMSRETGALFTMRGMPERKGVKQRQNTNIQTNILDIYAHSFFLVVLVSDGEGGQS